MRWKASLVCLLVGSMSWQTPLLAQNLYRCGNTYQDKPCADKEGKRIGGNRAPQTAPVPAAPVVIDPVCIQRGVDAQKIAWAREGGMSEEQMLAKFKTTHEKGLVLDVYRLSGSAAEIKSMVENLCQKRLQREGSPAPEAPLSAEREKALEQNSDKSTEKRPADKATSGKKPEDDKKAQCEQLRLQFDTLAKAQGGAAQEIAAQRKEFEKNLRSFGC